MPFSNGKEKKIREGKFEGDLFGHAKRRLKHSGEMIGAIFIREFVTHASLKLIGGRHNPEPRSEV